MDGRQPIARQCSGFKLRAEHAVDPSPVQCIYLTQLQTKVLPVTFHPLQSNGKLSSIVQNVYMAAHSGPRSMLSTSISTSCFYGRRAQLFQCITATRYQVSSSIVDIYHIRGDLLDSSHTHNILQVHSMLHRTSPPKTGRIRSV